MLEKLQALEERYNELTEEIAKPEIIADQANWQKLMKAHADLEPVVETYRAYRSALTAIDDAKIILDEERTLNCANWRSRNWKNSANPPPSWSSS